MSFSFCLLCNDSALFRTAQAPFCSDLSLEHGAPKGWGLAYYQSAQPLLRKQPKPVSEAVDFCDLVGNIRTNVMLAHVRGKSATGRASDNTQPFRFRQWTFCHRGAIASFDQIKPEMCSAIPDFMQRNIRGSTDSEVLFHLFLAFLNDANQLDEPRAQGPAIARALRSALLYVDRLAGEREGKATPYCCMATNGRVLVAAQSQTPLLVKRNSSYVNLGQGEDQRPLSYPHLKAVAIVGGREAVSPGWELVTGDTVLSVDADLNIDHLSADG